MLDNPLTATCLHPRRQWQKKLKKRFSTVMQQQKTQILNQKSYFSLRKHKYFATICQVPEIQKEPSVKDKWLAVAQKFPQENFMILYFARCEFWLNMPRSCFFIKFSSEIPKFRFRLPKKSPKPAWPVVSPAVQLGKKSPRLPPTRCLAHPEVPPLRSSRPQAVRPSIPVQVEEKNSKP